MFKSVINAFPIISRRFHNKPKYQLRHITPEQLDRIPYYQDKWLAIAQNPTGHDFKTVKHAIDNAYCAINLFPPKVSEFSSPQSLHGKFGEHQDQYTISESIAICFTKLILPVIVIWGVFSIIFLPFSGFMAALTILEWMNLSIDHKFIIVISITIMYIIVFQNADNSEIPQAIEKIAIILSQTLLLYLFLVAPVITYFQNHLNPLCAMAYLSGWICLFLWYSIGRLCIVSQWKKRLESKIRASIDSQAQGKIDRAFNTDWLEPWKIIGTMIVNANSSGKVRTISDNPFSSDNYLNIWDWIDWCSWVDFCISELGCTCDLKLWNSLQVLVQSCSMVLPRTKFCYISDQPTQIHFDEQQRLHGVGQPAISFADDTHLYFNQGVHLPSDYGKLHPHQWHSEWVLTETNAEIRRILIEGIGYGRVCQELNARTIDTWREYTLLWIELPTLIHANNRQVTEEPIFLLKMTCPSTKHIHALRVPPNIGSARTAAKWVNWDIDPEGFIIET
jgi:hypothetical protein